MDYQERDLKRRNIVGLIISVVLFVFLIVSIVLLFTVPLPDVSGNPSSSASASDSAGQTSGSGAVIAAVAVAFAMGLVRIAAILMSIVAASMILIVIIMRILALVRNRRYRPLFITGDVIMILAFFAMMVYGIVTVEYTTPVVWIVSVLCILSSCVLMGFDVMVNRKTPKKTVDVTKGLDQEK